MTGARVIVAVAGFAAPEDEARGKRGERKTIAGGPRRLYDWLRRRLMLRVWYCRRTRVRKTNSRRCYRKPRILTEKVFEQAALACGAIQLPGNVNSGLTNLKSNATGCGFSHS